tara:strand:- start:322 stop:597 length:276 start_codon:yes stop_codon:yes gene_type:complete
MNYEPDFSKIIIEPEWDWQWDWYYYIPDLNRKEWDGIEYLGVRYDWEEIDYRFGLDYSGPSVPEPADSGFFMAVIIAFVVLICLTLDRFKW